MLYITDHLKPKINHELSTAPFKVPLKAENLMIWTQLLELVCNFNSSKVIKYFVKQISALHRFQLWVLQCVTEESTEISMLTS